MKTTSPPHPRIAVVTVHGVANQKSSDTVRTTAKMLARAAELVSKVPQPHQPPPEQTNPKETLEDPIPTGQYSAFEEHPIRIPVFRVPTTDKPSTKDSSTGRKLKAALSYDNQSKTVTTRIASTTRMSDDDVGFEYMSELLESYEVSGDDSIYETLRLESTRTGSITDVDVYEMYWADLSRFVGNWLRWLIEFYQLLFDLCFLGKRSLGFARAQCEPAGKAADKPWWLAWPVFSGSQIIAQGALALFVPILNLYLLAAALSMAPLFLAPDSIPVAVEGFIGLAVALACAFAVYFKRTWFARDGHRWPKLLLAPLLALGIGVILHWSGLVSSTEHRYLWLMLAWWPLPLLTILWAMSAYQKRRPGAFPTALILGVVITPVYIYEVSLNHFDAPDVMAALLHTSEVILAILTVAWIALFVSAVVMTVSGAVAPCSVPDGPEREAARRASWTANLTLVLPGILVFIVNLTLWQALISVTVPTPKALATATATAAAVHSKSDTTANSIQSSALWNAPYVPCPGSKLCETLFQLGDTPTTAAGVTRELFRQSQTALYSVGLLFFALAAVLVIWTIIPAAVAEVWVRTTPSPTHLRNSASSWLGNSLSAGFRAMRLSGEVVRWAFIGIIPLGGFLFWRYAEGLKGARNHLDEFNALALFIGGWLVLALIAAKGPFSSIALGLSGALDIALDVMNWLRLRPLQQNPRGRICARFYSLLNHLESWKPRDSETGYDAIVILSHSQGTVIAADLLRYLAKIDQSPKLPIYLFTMGCPLRQLYGLRFPHLYGWATDGAQTWPSENPDPEQIGVTSWVNAYTSGDYVGRYLWYPDTLFANDSRWSVHPRLRTAAQKHEFCIGAGAHTHYWDDSAPEIAVELDQLVGLAARHAIVALVPSTGVSARAIAT